MLNQFSRTELLLGKEAMNKLENSRVAVFGIGGVGGYVCEALVRSGVGTFDLIDDDKVCLTNLNRQIIANRKTVGQYKTEVMRDRILDINPKADVRIHNCFYLPENAADNRSPCLLCTHDQFNLRSHCVHSIYHIIILTKIEISSILRK